MTSPTRTTRSCTRCGRSDVEFYDDPRSRRCKPCTREVSAARYTTLSQDPEFMERERKRLRRTDRRSPGQGLRRVSAHGVPTPERRRLAAEQGHLCSICGKHAVLHVDHDHGTGAFRGLLCMNCNLMLGHAHDDPAVLLAAIEYLAANR